MENLKTIVCLFSKVQAQNKSQQTEKKRREYVETCSIQNI